MKQAYREMVKKYHPDKYNDNPLKDLAEEKMREINEAYEYLTKNPSSQGNSGYREGGSYGGGNYTGGSSGYNDNGVFARARDYINRNNIRAAEDELNRTNIKNAEWYYLRGVIYMRKGWYSQAYEDLQRAVNMEPSNYEYREALNRVMYTNNSYQANAYRRRGSSNDMCDTLTCLCCTDQCCECMGGDLISCC